MVVHVSESATWTVSLTFCEHGHLAAEQTGVDTHPYILFPRYAEVHPQGPLETHFSEVEVC
jgi:hypothetical protein